MTAVVEWWRGWGRFVQEEVVRNGTGVLYVIGVIEESNLCCI